MVCDLSHHHPNTARRFGQPWCLLSLAYLRFCRWRWTGLHFDIRGLRDPRARLVEFAELMGLGRPLQAPLPLLEEQPPVSSSLSQQCYPLQSQSRYAFSFPQHHQEKNQVASETYSGLSRLSRLERNLWDIVVTVHCVMLTDTSHSHGCSSAFQTQFSLTDANSSYRCRPQSYWC